MELNLRVKELLRKMAILGSVLLLIAVGYWLSGFSFISVKTKSTLSNESYVYQITSGRNTSTFTSKSDSFKKLVRKGSYVVSAK